MYFDAPEASDLANVFSLNRAFLGWLASGRYRASDPVRLPPDTIRRIAALSPSAAKRLARTPFLLFRLADRDGRRWQPIFDRDPERDLFDESGPVDRQEADLVCAALGFLWNLSRRRPYVARIFSGADPGWCERLAESALVDVLQRAAASRGLVGLNRARDETFWQRLTVAGTDDDAGTRAAARFSALQTLLTRSPASARTRLPAAACAIPARERSRR